MTLKLPLVLAGAADQHAPLTSGDTLDPSVITVDSNKASLLASDPINGLGAYLSTGNTGRIALKGAGAVSDPLTADIVLSTANGNQLQSLPSGLFAGGLSDAPAKQFIDPASGTVFSPQFNAKYQSETFYIYGVDGGKYTLNLSGFTGNDALSPMYRVRLIVIGRGTGSITFTGNSVRSISGAGYSSGQYSIPYYTNDINIYDIVKTPGTAPYVTMVHPYQGRVCPAPYMVTTTATIGASDPINIVVPASVISGWKFYGRTNIRVKFRVAVSTAGVSSPLTIMNMNAQAGSNRGYNFACVVANSNAFAPYSDSEWIVTTVSALQLNGALLQFGATTQNTELVGKPLKVQLIVDIEAY